MPSKILLTMVCVCLIAGFRVNAQWQQTAPPVFGASIECFTLHGQALYAGARGGVFVTTDRGENWTPRNTGLANRTIISLASDGAVLCAGTFQGKMYRSADNGATWQAANAGLMGDIFRALFGREGYLLCGNEYGIFRSTDRALGWERVMNGTYPTSITTFAALGSEDIYAAGGYGEFLHSSNRGKDWKALPRVPAGGAEALLCTDSLFLLGTTNGLYSSTDKGLTWLPDTVMSVITGIRSLSWHAGMFYAGASDGNIYRSADARNGWETIVLSSDWTRPVSALFPSGSDLFAGSKDGVFRMVDPASALEQKNRGLTAVPVPVVCTRGSDLYAVHGGVLYRSSNAGTTWDSLHTGFFVNLVADTRAGLFAAGGAAGIYRFRDGISWDSANAGLPPATHVVEIRANGDSIVLGTSNGLFRSVDDGRSWSSLNAGFNGNPGYTAPFIANGGMLAASVSGRGMMTSRDDGGTWIEANTGLRNKDVYALAVSGTRIIAGTRWGLFSSDDFGMLWQWDTTSAPYWPVHALYPSGGQLLAGFMKHGVYRSADDGRTWAPFNTGLPDTITVLDITASETHLYAGTEDAGVWRRPISDLTGMNSFDERQIPDMAALYANFPNPFRGRTAVRFGLFQSQDVRLSIHDVLGRPVALLVDGRLSVGVHEFSFDPGRTRGVYLCRLSAGGTVYTRLILAE